jgi:hypothetical protein
MLGEQIGELTGQITGMRVLPDEGHGANVEVSFQQSGTLLGAHVNDMGTYISVTRCGRSANSLRCRSRNSAPGPRCR